VHAGQRYLSPEIGSRLAEHVARGDLTSREREVLRHMLEGLSNRQIAAALGLSEHTVNIHVRNIQSKLGVSGRTEAVTVALRKGILQLD